MNLNISMDIAPEQNSFFHSFLYQIRNNLIKNTNDKKADRDSVHSVHQS
jgi:hypothetical protein